MSSQSQTGVRLDRWLWAARFFKTRGLAAQAIAGGKVHLNGRRPKRARTVHVADTVRIRKGPYEYLVVVRGLSERRGPAPEAQQLFEETAASRRARDVVTAQLKVAGTTTFRGKGRPTKKERRDIERLKRNDET
jgi:ribosome-associated heat shock protein Hsp15